MRGRLYLISGPVDYLLMGGLSLLTFALLWATRATVPVARVATLAAWLAWVVNWPHFAATSYRLYQSPGRVAQFPITALLVPVLVGVGVALALRDPLDFAPAFVKLFLIWSPYHFSAQSLGLCLLYAQRAGVPFGAGERRALFGFLMLTFLCSTARGEVGGGSYGYFGLQVPQLGVPPWVGEGALWAMYLCGAGLCGLFLRRCWALGRVLPPIVLLPALAQYLWFIPTRDVPGMNELVPLFHSLQYLLIAWSVQLQERGGGVLRESLRFYGVSLLGGILLFRCLPQGLRLAGYPVELAVPVALAAVQIHHFFVDGVIWKLRDLRRPAALLALLLGLLCASPARAQDDPLTVIDQPLRVERLVLRTSIGDLVVALYAQAAPRPVAQLIGAARAGAFTGVPLLAVEPGRRLRFAPVPAAALAEAGETARLRPVKGRVALTAAGALEIFLQGGGRKAGRREPIVGHVEAGEEVLDALTRRGAAEIRGAQVMDSDALAKEVLQGPPPRPLHGGLLVALGLLLGGILAPLLVPALRGSQRRALCLLLACVGFFLLFAEGVARLRTPRQPLLALLLFGGTAAFVRLLSTFERSAAVDPRKGPPG